MKSIIDMAAAQELELYTENTREIYDRYTMPTVRNLTRKYKAGKYDAEKAVTAWGYVVEAAAKMYAKEFASPSAWHVIFNAATRREVAKSLERVYFEEYIKE